MYDTVMLIWLKMAAALSDNTGILTWIISMRRLGSSARGTYQYYGIVVITVM